jgi:hypothetical protein
LTFQLEIGKNVPEDKEVFGCGLPQRLFGFVVFLLEASYMSGGKIVWRKAQ